MNNMDRRRFLKRFATGTAMAGLATAGVLTGAGLSGASGGLDETYRGRSIHVTAAGNVYIDGMPLHVMRNADDSYCSVIDHHEKFPTLIDTARAAVDSLGGAELELVGHHHA
ncbi:tyrosinase family oxidase copper chaperone [Amycolatopsis anabasis]|uniref:tyrosinase family oxidase copper chaperone n=1 Tax=Amycolatopsis anabasis TaxID=1840409 RepID=UPI00131B0EBF|nr:tyrosinase family oxidase copper chaperone [Amycolatopsis anabasis]